MDAIPNPEDLEAIARWADPDGGGRVLSLYVDLGDGRHRKALSARRDAVGATLADDADAIDAFEAAWEAAREELPALRGAEGARAGAVFVAPGADRAAAFALGERVGTRAVWASRPHLQPLAQFLDAYEDLVVVAVDGEHATIHLVEAARARQVDRERANLGSRHGKGGMSQMRFQRHRETELERFFDAVTKRLDEALRESDAEQIVVAGPGTVKDQFVNRLPGRLAERVTAVETVDDGAAEGALRRFVELGRVHEAEGSTRAVEALQAALRRDEPTAAGPLEAASAAREGRVDLLLVREDASAEGARCEEHGTYLAPGETCSCGAEGEPVDLVGEAIEHATRTDARVEFVEEKAPLLDRLDGVGALLRW